MSACRRSRACSSACSPVRMRLPPAAVFIALGVLVSLPAEAGPEWQVKAFIGPVFGGSTTISDLDQGAGNVHRTWGGSLTALGNIFGVEAEFGRKPGFFQREATVRNSDTSSA